jgi:hypothetical protein
LASIARTRCHQRSSSRKTLKHQILRRELALFGASFLRRDFSLGGFVPQSGASMSTSVGSFCNPTRDRPELALFGATYIAPSVASFPIGHPGGFVPHYAPRWLRSV